MAWNDLSIAQKSQMMNFFRQRGVNSLSEMKQLYDSAYPSSGQSDWGGNVPPVFDEGGEKSLPVKRALKRLVGLIKNTVNTGRPFNTREVADRVPGEEFDKRGTQGPIDAVKHYLFNDDNYVTNRIDSIVKKTPDDAFYKDELINQIKAHEDAKRIYLGLPQKYDSFEPSPYRPTIGHSDNPYQLNSLLQDDEFNYVIEPAWTQWKGSTEGGEFFIKNLGDKAQLANIPTLHNAGLSIGMDNKGQYLSLYDVWDYNTKIKEKSGDNIHKLVGGKPFDIYQRYYLDDWYDVPEEDRGNPYIAPAHKVGVRPSQYTTSIETLPVDPEMERIVDESRMVGSKIRAEGGKIHIKKSKRGTFTAAAKKRGMSVQAFARKVLANPDEYSPAMRKKANFARNFGGKKYSNGGYLLGGVYDLTEELINELNRLGYGVEQA